MAAGYMAVLALPAVRRFFELVSPSVPLVMTALAGIAVTAVLARAGLRLAER
jgi:hypothetical protein